MKTCFEALKNAFTHNATEAAGDYKEEATSSSSVSWLLMVITHYVATDGHHSYIVLPRTVVMVMPRLYYVVGHTDSSHECLQAL